MSTRAGSHPWRPRWVEVADSTLGVGGQGIASLVHENGDASRRYVLKRLKRNDVPERRGRMYREVAALRTLDSPGIPRCIDSNADEFEGATPLYLVQEYIAGETVEQRVARQRLTPDEALGLLEALLGPIGTCHEIGIVHRDIKPDNVVLRDGDPLRPVLIDFGLSFNLEDPAPAHETATGEQLTNRFLALPEFASSESNKRSPISDLTLVIGLVMFSLTGTIPATLLDERRQAPHQRERAGAVLAAMPPAQAALFGELFGRAFEHAMTRRWHSVAEIRGVLQRYRTTTQSTPAVDLSTTIADLRNRRNSSPRYADRDEIGRYFKSLKDLCKQVFDRAAQALGRGYGVQQGQGPIEWNRFIHTFRYGISGTTMDLATKAELWCHFEVEATSTEVVLKGRIQQESTMEELFRTGLHSEFAGEAVTEVVEHLLQRLLVTVARDHEI